MKALKLSTKHFLSFLSFYSIFFPVLWFMGLDQLLIMLLSVCMLFFYGFVLRERKLKKFEITYLFFLLGVICSFYFIEESKRYFEWIRSFISLTLVINLALILRNIEITDVLNHVDKFTKWMLVWSIVGALLSYILGDATFNAPIKIFIPNSFDNYSLIKNLYTRNLGDYYYTIFGSIIRPSGFFSYPTGLANTTLLLATLNYTVSGILRRRIGLFKYLLYGFALIVIFLTTTRTSIAGSLLIILVILFLKKPKIFYLSLIPSAVLFFVGFAFIQEQVVQFMEIRGTGSSSARFLLYELTFDKFKERPVFGWGGQISSILGIPLGSHSTYINILFCFGFFGFITFYLFHGYILVDLLRRRSSFLFFMIAYLFMSITEVFYLDFITTLTVSLFYLTYYNFYYGNSATDNKSLFYRLDR